MLIFNDKTFHERENVLYFGFHSNFAIVERESGGAHMQPPTSFHISILPFLFIPEEESGFQQ